MKYNVIIIGGGVSGTALLYTLSKYTDVKSIALFEKCPDLGLVNSSPFMNSQTLHFGDIETNYTYEKAKKVKRYADMVMNYLENEKSIKGDEKLFIKVPKMVLAVGKEQTNTLRERYKVFGSLFPKLRIAEKEEIGRIEPRILEGRNPEEDLLAMVTEDGYTVDFGKLCHSFVNNARVLNPSVEIHLLTKVRKLLRKEDTYLIRTDKGEFEAEAVVVAAGSYSLKFAKSLGYGRNTQYFLWPEVFIPARKYLTARFIPCKTQSFPSLRFMAILKYKMKILQDSALLPNPYFFLKDTGNPRSGDTGKLSASA